MKYVICIIQKTGVIKQLKKTDTYINKRIKRKPELKAKSQQVSLRPALQNINVLCGPLTPQAG